MTGLDYMIRTNRMTIDKTTWMAGITGMTRMTGMPRITMMRG